MSNYLKIPLPQHSSFVIPLINDLLKTSPRWDGVTEVVGVVIKDKSMVFTFIKTDGSESTDEEKDNNYLAISELGIQYEYNV